MRLRKKKKGFETKEILISIKRASMLDNGTIYSIQFSDILSINNQSEVEPIRDALFRKLKRKVDSKFVGMGRVHS